MVLSALLVFAIVEVHSFSSYPGTLGPDNQKCPLLRTQLLGTFVLLIEVI